MTDHDGSTVATKTRALRTRTRQDPPPETGGRDRGPQARTRQGRTGTQRRPATPGGPVDSPRHTRPNPAAAQVKTAKAPKAPEAPRTPKGLKGATGPKGFSRVTPESSARMPFVLLLCGLLGGALVSLLVISTTLAEGSFQINNLQQQNANLAREKQLLTEEVAQGQAPAQIMSEAEQLGMRPDTHLRFLDVKTGKVVSAP